MKVMWYRKSYLIVDTFTMNATEERLVPVVRFDEPATVSGHKGSAIQLLIPVAGGYYNVGRGWPWWLPIGAYAFTLTATSKEAGARGVGPFRIKNRLSSSLLL